MNYRGNPRPAAERNRLLRRLWPSSKIMIRRATGRSVNGSGLTAAQAVCAIAAGYLLLPQLTDVVHGRRMGELWKPSPPFCDFEGELADAVRSLAEEFREFPQLPGMLECQRGFPIRRPRPRSHRRTGLGGYRKAAPCRRRASGTGAYLKSVVREYCAAYRKHPPAPLSFRKWVGEPWRCNGSGTGSRSALAANLSACWDRTGFPSLVGRTLAGGTVVCQRRVWTMGRPVDRR